MWKNASIDLIYVVAYVYFVNMISSVKYGFQFKLQPFFFVIQQRL